MCARCPIGGGYPSYGWPGTRPHDSGAGDYGPAPDLGRPDFGAAPPRTLFGLGPRKVKPFKYGRWARWAHRDD